MKKDIIGSFGIKEAGLTPQAEDLFAISSIGVVNSTILEKVVLPQRLDGALFCICERGDMEIMINSKIYKLTRNDMLVILPQSIFQLLSVSDDIELYAMGATAEFVTNADIDSAIPLFLFLREHSKTSLLAEDKKVLIELSEMLRIKSEREDNSYLKEILNSLLLALLYEIITIYLRQKPVTQSATKRNNELFSKFVTLVYENCTKERELKFYASQIHITPKHLSYVVHDASGKAATKWISESVIINAKALLKSSKMSISQIADYLNFPNASFFCQYFKKHTGITPKSLQSNT